MNFADFQLLGSRCNGGQGGGAALSTCLCLHAEENALLEAGRERIREGAVLYCDTYVEAQLSSQETNLYEDVLALLAALRSCRSESPKLSTRKDTIWTLRYAPSLDWPMPGLVKFHGVWH